MVNDRFPLPVVQDALDQLQTGKVFPTLDLRNGFFNVDVDKLSRKYTAFVTHQGQYEFLKLPFELASSPSVFQRYIYHVLRDLINDGTVIVYRDDIIIPSCDKNKGAKRLTRVLKTASM